MVIVAGHITVAPEEREAYLASCVGVVEAARNAAGCRDFAISADLLDPGRINVYERWDSQETVEAFRQGGPPEEQQAVILSMAVEEFTVGS